MSQIFLPYFRPLFDIQDHIWYRMQKANKRIKLDRQKSARQTDFFHRELDENLLHIQRKIRNTRQFQKDMETSHLSRIKLAELTRTESAVSCHNKTQKFRPNSSKILRDISKSIVFFFQTAYESFR